MNVYFQFDMIHLHTCILTSVSGGQRQVEGCCKREQMVYIE